MHCECLPDSLVSKIGVGYAKSFYRYVDRSEKELCFLHHSGSDVVSACIVSLEPRTLQKRLVTHTPLALRAPLAIRRLPLRQMARGLLPGSSGGDGNVQPDGPEVLLIFTQPSARGTGIGSETLARCEDFLHERGYRSYYVKTLDHEENRAVVFYKRNGFSQLGSIAKHGKRLGVWEKTL